MRIKKHCLQDRLARADILTVGLKDEGIRWIRPEFSRGKCLLAAGHGASCRCSDRLRPLRRETVASIRQDIINLTGDALSTERSSALCGQP